MFDVPAEAWEPLEKSPEVPSFVLADEGKRQRGLEPLPPPRDPEQREPGPWGPCINPYRSRYSSSCFPSKVRWLPGSFAHIQGLFALLSWGPFPPAAVVAGNLRCDALPSLLPRDSPAPSSAAIFVWDQG